MNIFYKLFPTCDKALISRIADFWIRTSYAPSIPKNKIKRHLFWKYNNKYAAVALAISGNRIVGSCAKFDVKAKTKFGLLTARWGNDSSTDPTYAKINKFIFLRVYRKIVSPFLKGDIDIGLCFPNKLIAQTYLKIGWLDLKNTFLFTSKLNRKGIDTDKNKAIQKVLDKMFKNLSFRRFKKIDINIDKFFSSIAYKFAFIVERNKEYLHWRYLECPSKQYDIYIAKCCAKIFGYVVLREAIVNNLKMGYIVDILADPEDDKMFYYLIAKAKKIFEEHNVDAVTCISSHRVLQKVLINSDFTVNKKIDFFILLKKQKTLQALLKEKKQWFVTMGDGDFEMED